MDPEVLSQIIREAGLLKSRSSRPEPSFDVWVDRALKKRQRAASRVAEAFDGVVASVTGAEVHVEVQGELHRVVGCLTSLVVGDEVRLGFADHGPVVAEVKPRRTRLSRPSVDKDRHEQVIAANMDAVVIVVSVVSPPFHPRLIDRYLVAVQNGGARPMLAVNKMDLQAEAPPGLEAYLAAGLSPFLCSTETGRGIDELRDAVRGLTSVFVGHSGVGKSSLINRLYPGLGQKTGEVMKGYGRGAHTTTWSSLHRLPDGSCLIDTPGVRSFGLWQTSRSVLEDSFPEFAGIECRFRNCRHQSEPGCGVLEAVRRGEVSAERHGAYLRLLEETV